MGEQITQVWNDLKFNGSVLNLLRYELKLELASEKGTFKFYRPASSSTQLLYCGEDPAASIEVVNADPLGFIGEYDEVGLFNGEIRLIRPNAAPKPLTVPNPLRRYYSDLIKYKQAQVRNFPDMKALRKQPYKTYVITDVGTAIVAHLKRYEELDFVLIPALPISPEGDPAAGFRALIPARYFIDQDPLFYQYDPSRWRPEYEGRHESV